MIKKLASSFFFVFSMFIAYAQNHYIDARVKPAGIMSGHLKMGNPGPSGKEILANSKYITIGGKAVIPVMGEMHFSRYPKEQWEDAILKMKANGINIVACYLFWIYHEEVEGQFDWSGNRDFRGFVKLCQKHGLYVYPRIGPWCHGEVRNGGTPDWILDKKYLTDRSDDPAYQHYVERWYGEIAGQMKGLLYKDGGPVIGIQLENEYHGGAKGEEHIMWLKQTARRWGMDVPLYTITGWDNASIPKGDEVIPLWGGYPDEPWAANLEKMKKNPNFTFQAPMNDENIGNDLSQKDKKYSADYSHFPYLTCEIGIGNQIAEHRRPVLGPLDGLSIALTKLGSGSNMPGYYVFTGGQNSIGLYTTLEENRDETGYPNEYPDISYDFQAAIRETGELAPSYYQLKKLHYFLNEFGSKMAPMTPVIPQIKNEDSLQYAVRVKDGSGFLFGLNYYRGRIKSEQKNVSFSLNLDKEELKFPAKPVNIPDSCFFIWPFNFDMDGVLLKYATAQPLCKIEDGNVTNWFFVQSKGISPEFSFDASAIINLEAGKAKVTLNDGKYMVTNLKPGMNEYVRIDRKDGKQQHIWVLLPDEASHAWLFNENGKKQFFISDANLYMNGNRLHVYGNSPRMNIFSLEKNLKLDQDGKTIAGQPSGAFTRYTVDVAPVHFKPELKKYQLFDDAQWLKTSVPEVNSGNLLNNTLFIKEFNLGNPSSIKSATLFLMNQMPCKIELNGTWVNAMANVNQINAIDITGYVHKGENRLMLVFPFSDTRAAFAARLEVEYFNTDQVVVLTDQSWLTTGQYTLPSPISTVKGLKAPEVVDAVKVDYDSFKSVHSDWTVAIPDCMPEQLNGLFVHVDYTGDKGRCRLGHRLISDNFNNGTSWLIDLKRLGTKAEGQKLRFELFPLQPGYKIYFEKTPAKEETGRTNIKNIQFIPEYQVDLSVD